MYDTGFIYLLSISLVILIFSSLIFASFEHDSLQNALWWAISTATTVGYGDVVPKTDGGKIISAVLMLGGIGFLGLLTSTITDFFTTQDKQDDQTDTLKQLTKQVAHLSKQVNQMQKELKKKRAMKSSHPLKVIRKIGGWLISMFERGAIEVHDAYQNNLKHVDLKIPKYAITVFAGLSGSGKSSLVFDTIAAASRRELNETFPSFTQQYLPKYGQPHVKSIEHLPVAIVIEQKRIGKNARSTLSTYTGIYSLLRLLFSRAGKPFVGYSDTFSFNLPQGMCQKCQGLGYVDDIDAKALIDPEKSLNQGAITFVSFGPHTWRWRRYTDSGLFDNDKPLKDYTKDEMNTLLYAPQQTLKNAPKAWHRTALYEGIVPRIRRSIIGKREAQHHKEALAKIVTRRPCPACHGTRLRPEVLTCTINNKILPMFCRWI